VEWAIEYVATELVPAVGVRFVTVDALYDYAKAKEVADALLSRIGWILQVCVCKALNRYYQWVRLN
jgi:hypothetical protein